MKPRSKHAGSNQSVVEARRLIGAAILWGAASWQACATPVEQRANDVAVSNVTATTWVPGRYAALGEPIDEAIVREVMTDDWAGHQLGLSLPLAYDLGPFLAARAAGGPGLREIIPDDREITVNDPDFSVAVFFGDHVYMVDLEPSESLGRLVAERVERDLDGVFDSEDPPPARNLENGDVGVATSAVVTGSGDDADNRIPLGIDGPCAEGTNADAWDTIGIVLGADEAYGTGTLISPTVVLTAAHIVVVDVGGDGVAAAPITFRPRADGIDCSPWGTYELVASAMTAAFFPPEYVDLGCHQSSTTACIRHDYAVVRFAFPTDVTPAKRLPSKRYMASGSLEITDQLNLKNRGYPTCGEVDSPPDCAPEVLFGAEVEPCETIRPVLADPDIYGEPTDITARHEILLHDCDTNHGHSGSPIYDYINQIPTIIGIHTASCDAGDMDEPCVTAGDHRNWMRAVTPEMKFHMDSFAVP